MTPLATTERQFAQGRDDDPRNWLGNLGNAVAPQCPMPNAQCPIPYSPFPIPMNPNWLPKSKAQKLRQRLLNDPYYRLKSGEEIAIAVEVGIRIDANQATVDDWLRLPGLSIHQARTLVELARSGVKFYCIEDVAAAISLPAQRLKPLEAILIFGYYDDESLENITYVVNPNTATVESLLKVPFIDSSLAQAVVENRSSLGPYRNIVDFQKRLNLSGEILAQLMYYLQF